MNRRLKNYVFSDHILWTEGLSKDHMDQIFKGLPGDAKITCWGNFENRAMSFFRVMSNSFPEIPEGTMIPEEVFTFNTPEKFKNVIKKYDYSTNVWKGIDFAYDPELTQSDWYVSGVDKTEKSLTLKKLQDTVKTFNETHGSSDTKLHGNSENYRTQKVEKQILDEFSSQTPVTFDEPGIYYYEFINGRNRVINYFTDWSKRPNSLANNMNFIHADGPFYLAQTKDLTVIYTGNKIKKRVGFNDSFHIPYGVETLPPTLGLSGYLNILEKSKEELKEIYPNKTKICECGKEKHGFVSHSEWCEIKNDC